MNFFRKSQTLSQKNAMLASSSCPSNAARASGSCNPTGRMLSLLDSHPWVGVTILERRSGLSTVWLVASYRNAFDLSFYLESRLAAELRYIESTFRKHLVVYIGSPHAQYLSRRQSSPSTIQYGPTPSGGILHRYQLLTPALIITLLVTFFILMPVVYFGVSALASIQSPLKVEAPKGYNAQEKKNY